MPPTEDKEMSLFMFSENGLDLMGHIGIYRVAWGMTIFLRIDTYDSTFFQYLSLLS